MTRGHLRGGPDEISDQRVHRVDQSAHDPVAAGSRTPLIDLPFSSNLVPDTRELVGHLLVIRRPRERLCDLSIDPYQIHGQADRKIALLTLAKRSKALASSASGNKL